ncbi:MAG: zinc ribbon domain-containing protein [Patescibacteria group bacterium]
MDNDHDDAQQSSRCECEIDKNCKCRACGMVIKQEKDFGTEADGSKNCDYCIHCYQNGVLISDEPKAGW